MVQHYELLACDGCSPCCDDLPSRDLPEVGSRVYHWNVRVNLDKLLEIDPSKETFKAQFFFHARHEYDVADEGQVKEDMKKLEQRLRVENSMDLFGEDVDPGRLPKVELKDGKAELQWVIRGEFAEPLELNHFPFDTQELKLVIKVGMPVRPSTPLHKFHDTPGASKVNLNVWPLYQAWTKPTTIDFKWDLSNPDHNHYRDSFPMLTARVKVTRRPSYHIWSVAVPLCFLVIMSWCSFAIASDKKAERLSASLTLVLTAVVYKCEVPNISYSTLLDKYISVCWLFLFLMVVENCFAEQLQSLTENELHIFFGFFLVPFVLCNLCFWSYGIHTYRKKTPLNSVF